MAAEIILFSLAKHKRGGPKDKTGKRERAVATVGSP